MQQSEQEFVSDDEQLKLSRHNVNVPEWTFEVCQKKPLAFSKDRVLERELPADSEREICLASVYIQ